MYSYEKGHGLSKRAKIKHNKRAKINIGYFYFKSYGVRGHVPTTPWSNGTFQVSNVAPTWNISTWH